MNCESLDEAIQRARIVSDLNRNMFVEAGAGAGKTTIMVSRIVEQLVNGECNPNQIVAITFTNAATNVLRTRIMECLQGKRNDENLSQTQLENLNNCLADLDQMQISTIHSFCSRLLSERLFDAKLPAGIRVIEKDEKEELAEKSFQQWAQGLSANDWTELLPAVNNNRSDALLRLKNLMLDLLNLASDVKIKASYDRSINQDRPITLADLEANTDQKCSDFIAELLSVLNYAYKSNVTDFGNVSDDQLYKYGKELRDAWTAKDREKFLAILVKEPTSKSFCIKITQADIKKYWQAKTKDLKEIQTDIARKEEGLRDSIFGNKGKNYKNNVLPWLAGYENEKHLPYIKYAKAARDYFYEHFAKELLTNDLLIRKARDLVKTEQAWNYFSGKFKCIYVDEFQDTDHLQKEIFWNLAAKTFGSDELRDGALFVVGDPKQSIYRFRGAEPAVYFHAKEEMEQMANAEVFNLAINHRSNNEVIQWVNEKFMDKAITRGRKYVPMKEYQILPGSMPENVIHGVHWFNPENMAYALCGKAKAADYPEVDFSNITPEIHADILAPKIDAGSLAKFIRVLVSKDYLLPKYDKDGQTWNYRKIVYSDFLVLCAQKDRMEQYVEVLKKNEIPVVMDGKTDLSANPAMLRFERIYRYLAAPFDRLNYVGAMEVLKKDGVENEEEVQAILECMRKETQYLSAYGLLEYLKQKPELWMGMGTEVKKDRFLQNMTRITQMTETLLEKAKGNKIEMAKAIRAYLEREMEHEMLLEESPNAVRFMNVHKAKGLEGNIVIWTNRGETKYNGKDKYQENLDFYPQINSFFGGIWHGINRDENRIKLSQEESDAERIRLEYVGATRAIHALFFMPCLGVPKSQPMFSEGFQSEESELMKKICEEAESLGAPSAPGSKNQSASEQKDELEGLGAKVFCSVSPSDYEIHKRSTKIMDHKRTGWLERPVGSVYGTTMHRCFELLICRYEMLLNDKDGLIASCVNQAIAENAKEICDDELEKYRVFLRAEADALLEWYEGDFRKKHNIRNIYTEMPFSFMTKSRELQADNEDVESGHEAESQAGMEMVKQTEIEKQAEMGQRAETDRQMEDWLHGSADLVIELEDGRFCLFDYKSDSDERYSTEEDYKEHLTDTYTEQIKAYRRAIAHMFLGGNGEEEMADRIFGSLISFTQNNTKEEKPVRIIFTEIN